ncbi:hypothetical protein [Flavobacterium sp.]|jgi:hypothetical protein|uniref:hypothetical protein n=1 Tax=Flavobacterium sp. TaxID=239 RepID=UPI0037C029ED
MIRLPQLSPTSLGNPAAPTPDVSSGTNQIANAIGQVSGAFVKISHDIARADNARKKSEFRQTLGKNYADLQIQLQTITDPQERLTRTNDFLASQRAAVDNPDFPPVLVEELRTYYDDFATTAQIRSAQDAAELTQTRARKAIQNELEAAKQYNDPVAFQNAVTDYVESGLGLPEDGEALMADFQQSAAESNYLALIQQEPQGALLDLQSEDFSTRNPTIIPSAIPNLQRYAQGLIQDRRAQEIDIIDTAILQGQFKPQDLEAAEYLTPKDRAQILSQQNRKTGPPPTPLHSAAWDKMFALRDQFADLSISDEEYAAAWNDTRLEIYTHIPDDYRGDFTQEFSYRSPANRKGGKPINASPDKDLKSNAQQRIKRAFDSGLFGEKDSNKAFDHFQKLNIHLNNWMEANPDKPWPEVQSYTQTLISGTFTDADALLIPLAPAPISFDDRLNNALGLPPGPPGADTALLPPKP